MNPDPSGGLLGGINVLFAVAGLLVLIGFVVAVVVASIRGSRRVTHGVDWDRELRSLSGRPSVEDQLIEIERRFAAKLITADEREALRISVLSTLQ